MEGPKKAAQWWGKTLRDRGMSFSRVSRIQGDLEIFLQKKLQKGKNFFIFCDSGPRSHLKEIWEKSRGELENGDLQYFPTRARMKIGEKRVEVSVGIGEPWKVL